MTSLEFIERIRRVIYDDSVSGVLTLMNKPPGRRPSPELIALSEWFNQLPASDRERVRNVVELAVRSSVLGMLTVLDGVTSIREQNEEIGSFKLVWETANKEVVLNDPASAFLHDLFIREVPPK